MRLPASGGTRKWAAGPSFVPGEMTPRRRIREKFRVFPDGRCAMRTQASAASRWKPAAADHPSRFVAPDSRRERPLEKFRTKKARRCQRGTRRSGSPAVHSEPAHSQVHESSRSFPRRWRFTREIDVASHAQPPAAAHRIPGTPSFAATATRPRLPQLRQAFESRASLCLPSRAALVSKSQYSADIGDR